MSPIIDRRADQSTPVVSADPEAWVSVSLPEDADAKAAAPEEALPPMCADARCDTRHRLLPDHIEVRDPDDEIVAHRSFVHIERMDDDAVWVGLTDPDGNHVAVDFYARKNKLVMVVR